MDRLFDSIRKCSVRAFPEEKVRQNLVLKMQHELGFPKNLIAVEKELENLPHLKDISFVVKKRRADIICFAKDIHPDFSLYPLLLVECKAVKLTQATIDQVLGYNHYVKAYFICIANQDQIKTFWYNSLKKGYDSVDFLPSFEELLNAVKKT